MICQSVKTLHCCFGLNLSKNAGEMRFISKNRCYRISWGDIQICSTKNYLQASLSTRFSNQNNGSGSWLLVSVRWVFVVVVQRASRFSHRFRLHVSVCRGCIWYLCTYNQWSNNNDRNIRTLLCKQLQHIIDLCVHIRMVICRYFTHTHRTPCTPISDRFRMFRKVLIYVCIDFSLTTEHKEREREHRPFSKIRKLRT